MNGRAASLSLTGVLEGRQDVVGAVQQIGQGSIEEFKIWQCKEDTTRYAGSSLDGGR